MVLHDNPYSKKSGVFRKSDMYDIAVIYIEHGYAIPTNCIGDILHRLKRDKKLDQKTVRRAIKKGIRECIKI